jgi:glycosyltransferase involved in cell wall biosynthesis
VIRALLPAIHARPTGGNLYNRRILTELARFTQVKREIVFPGDRERPVRRRRPGPRPILLIDSLLIDQVVDGAVVIAHYLETVDPERWHGARAARERELLSRCRGVVATSDYTRDVLQQLQVATIAPGLDDRYRREVAPRANATPRLVTVANLLPGKGFVEMLDVLETLADLPWRWDIAGDTRLDAEHAERFRARLGRSPVARRVTMHGALPAARVAALYERGDIFVLPTRFETCSMVTREAMARALPVVAYRIGGLPANLPEATRHLLATPYDAGALAASLRRLLADPAERAETGRLNREAAMKFPTWEDSGRALHEFLVTIFRP